MDRNGQMEVHYINTGCPYTVTESFMDFFEGLTHPHEHYAHAVAMQDQERAYLTMNMNAYKFRLSASGTPPYYGHYGVYDYLPRFDRSRRVYEYPSMSYIEQPTAAEIQAEEIAGPTMEVILECHSCSVLTCPALQIMIVLLIGRLFGKTILIRTT